MLPALRRQVDPDPLFIFAGGPGQGARGFGGVAARFFKKVRRSRDIVLIDLRGTGGSAPLQCPDTGDDLSVTLEEIAAQVSQCRDALTANPRFYTHEESLADVDEIRERLGYETINLWGGSWGTRAALLYALRYPKATRSVVLDGAAPLDVEFPRTVSADANAALTRLLADCAVDRECARAFPDPRAMLRELEGRFVAGPVSTRLKHPRTGEPTTALLHGDMVVEIIRGALYCAARRRGAARGNPPRRRWRLLAAGRATPADGVVELRRDGPRRDLCGLVLRRSASHGGC